MLLEDAVKEFKFDMEIKNFSPRTIRTALNNSKAFFKYINTEFDVEELEDVTSLHVKKYISYLKKLGRSEVYLNGILKNLRMFYRYCIQEEYILEKQNPTLKVKWIKEPKVIINTFNDNEVRRMLKQWDFKNYYNTRNKAIIAVLFETGIRNLELCSLNLTDVRERVILVHGKGNKERYVPISPALKKTLIKYERFREAYIKNKFVTDDAYFLSYRGNRLTIGAVERVVRETGEMARVRKEIRCSPHTVRHYYAQFMLRQGLDVYTVSRLLGHENITITKRYLQSLKDDEIINMSMDTSPLMKLK